MVGVYLPYNRIFIIALSIICVLGIYFALFRSNLGLRVRAVTQNRNMSACLGIPTRKVDSYTFAFGSGLAGIAGWALTMVGNVDPGLGQNYIVDAFMVVVTGGVGKLAGHDRGLAGDRRAEQADRAVLRRRVRQGLHPRAGDSVLAVAAVWTVCDEGTRCRLRTGNKEPAGKTMSDGTTNSNRGVGLAFWVVGGILLVAMPLLNILPPEDSWLHLSDFSLNRFGKFLAYGILALGLDLIWGYTGILSLGQGVFFGLGAYCMGMHMMLTIGKESVYGSDLPDFMVWNQVKELPLFWYPFYSFPVAVIGAVLVPMLFALVFGFFAFRSRIKGVYFAIITQALALAAWLVFNRNETKLGGTNGLTDFKQRARVSALRTRHAAGVVYTHRALSRRGLSLVPAGSFARGPAGCWSPCGTARSASSFPGTPRPPTNCSSLSWPRPWPDWPGCCMPLRSASSRRRRSGCCRRLKWSFGWRWVAVAAWQGRY